MQHAAGRRCGQIVYSCINHMDTLLVCFLSGFRSVECEFGCRSLMTRGRRQIFIRAAGPLSTVDSSRNSRLRQAAKSSRILGAGLGEAGASGNLWRSTTTRTRWGRLGAARSPENVL
jgi:hypothetical protein